MKHNLRFSACLCLFAYFSATATATAFAIGTASNTIDLKILTFNLHGYHPMGERLRYLQDRSGNVTLASSFLTYFTPAEIHRGQARQLSRLTDHIERLQPDVIFLQEVGAGLPNSKKDCAEYYADIKSDVFGKNSALRLRDRLRARGYAVDSAIGCRGNIGWVTNADTFRQQRILRPATRARSTALEVVYDFDSNPFPNGFIVEGTAILVRSPWRILESKEWRLPISQSGETFFMQLARIQREPRSPWFLLVNLHGTHKVRHFESSVAVRQAIARFIAAHPERSRYGGTVLGGDMNARLYRPTEGRGEVDTIPWEGSHSGEFDYDANTPDGDFARLHEKLWQLNVDPNYKPRASLGDSQEARLRVAQAITKFVEFTKDPLAKLVRLREAYSEAVQAGQCNPKSYREMDASCEKIGLIDLLYASSEFSTRRAALLFSRDNWTSLDGPSDHPGVFLEVSARSSH